MRLCRFSSLVLMAALATASCANYFSDDSIEAVGVDKRSSSGFERQANRPTRIDDKYFHFSIGYKRLAAYGNDKRVAAEAVSKQIISERGYCPRGYQVHADPNVSTGSYGYHWFVECND